MTRQRHPETINSKFVTHLLTNNYSDLSATDRVLLPKMKSKHNRINPQYKKMGVYLDDRNWCLKGLGALSRRTRNTLAFQHYIDIDIKCSVYSVLSHLAHKHGQECSAIDEHIQNRAICLKMLMKKGRTRDEAKMLYMTKPFSDYSAWHDISKMKRLDQELLNLQQFYARMPEHEATKRFITTKGSSIRGGNINGKLMSHIYFTEEWAIIDKAMDFLESKGVLPVADLHDGFFIPRDADENIIDLLNTYIQEVAGYKEITFAKKKMKDFLPGIDPAMLSDFDNYQGEVETKEYEALKEEFETLVAFCAKDSKFIVKHPIVDEWMLKSKDDLILEFDYHKMFDGNNNMTVFTDKAATFVRNWMRDPNKKTYVKQEFIPDRDVCPPHIYNTFEGFYIEKYEPVNQSIKDEEDLQIILGHLRRLCDDGSDQVEAMTEYLTDWIAHLFQHPTGRTNAMPILKGGEGIGKTMLAELLGTLMGGGHINKYYFKTPKPEQYVFGHFNSQIANKMLVAFEEIEKVGTDKFYSKLKDFVTTDRMTSNAKFQQEKEIRTYIRCIATTNDEDTINISDSNRRFVPIESKREKMTTDEVDATVEAFFHNHNALKLFYNYLMERDISKRVWSDFPKTDFYNRLMNGTADPVMSFVCDFFHTMKQFKQYRERDYICETELYASYSDHCVDYRFQPKNRRDFMNKMLELNNLFRQEHHRSRNQKVLTFDLMRVVTYLKNRGYKIVEGDSGVGSSYSNDEEEDSGEIHDI